MGEVDALIDEFAAKLACTDVVFGHGTDNAGDEAYRLVTDALGDGPLTATARQCLDALLACRIDERMPLPHLTGKAWFGGMVFKVSPATMIPRSPIAEVLAGGVRPWLGAEPRRILDLCCGVGALGIVAARVFPNADVDLADDDPAALALARENAECAGAAIAKRVNVIDTDLFEGLRGRYDLILCNPPYVPSTELDGAPPEFRHEPRHGLDGGSDGLRVWRRIVADMDDYLGHAGIMVGEAGNVAEAFDAAFPHLGAVWLALRDAERQADGGYGVFVATPALR